MTFNFEISMSIKGKMVHKPIPIGTKFGMLSIDSEPVKDGKKIKYWFVCRCGGRKQINIVLVRTGKTTSCGCKTKVELHCVDCNTKDPLNFAPKSKSVCRRCRTQRDRERIRNNPESRQKRADSAVKNQQKNIRNFLARQLGRTKKNGYKKKIAVDVELGFLLQLWDRQDGKCALTGIQMSHRYHDLRSVSIDRLDSSKSYTPFNIQLVCKAMNLGKGPHSQHEMLEFLQEVRITQKPDQNEMLNVRKQAYLAAPAIAPNAKDYLDKLEMNWISIDF